VIGAIATVRLTTGWLRKMSNERLTRIFAVLMSFAGILMLTRTSHKPAANLSYLFPASL